MASCTHAIGTADTGATPNTSGAFVPAVGDLLIVFIIASDTTQATATLTSSIGGFTFTQITRGSDGVSSVYAFVSNALVSNNASQTVAFDSAPDAATGTIIFVCRVSDMARTGLSAIRQSSPNTGGAGTAPNGAFSSSALTSNPTLGAVKNGASPAGLTPPTNWTEPASGDLGYSNPTTGGEYVFRDNGFTSTSITWGATSGTAWASVIVELDASLPFTPYRPVMPQLLAQ
jgi:hypothetical protein